MPMFKMLQKLLGLLIATTFVATFFCMSTEVSLNKGDQTSCCISTFSHASTHQIDFGEHVRHWQQAFAATQPSPNNLLSLLSAIFATLGFGVFISQFRSNEPKLNLFSSKLCRERNAIAKLFDSILQALSNGILNPKLYNLSIIIR